MRVAIETLGCSKNTVDSEYMAGYLVDAGYEITDYPEEADHIIVNTCSFILDAKVQSIDLIVEMADLVSEDPSKSLIVAGCLAERYAEDLRLEIPEVSAFVGTANYDLIVKVLREIEANSKLYNFTGDKNRLFEPKTDRFLTGARHYAYLKISEGCNNACAFCIIPKLKGRYRSRTVDSLIKEAEMLAKNGVKELILIAQDTSRYGIDFKIDGARRDEPPCSGLINLLGRLEKIEGIEWIRIHYLYPDIVEDNFVDYIASSKKVLPYFDIPLQHISDNVLKRMRRNTDKVSIKKLISKIRKSIPHACIRTTLIAGFPGETEEDFEELCEFISEYKLDRVGVFQYSSEEDTLAATLDGQVSEDDKALRQGRLMELQMLVSEERQSARIGKIEKVIIDYFDGEYYVGRTFADAPDIDGISYIAAEEGSLREGDIVEVRVVGVVDIHDVVVEVR